MFDKTKAEKAVNFINMLKHTGDYHGISFDLLDWERQIVWDVFGTMHPDDLTRRLFRTVYIEMSKKNGKSELLGAIACKHLFDSEERNGEIYGCAGDREQASIIYHTAVEMIEQNPSLEKRVDIRDSYKLIVNKKTNTFYKVLSAESYTKHGIRPSVVLFDELHVQPNRDLWDTMTRGAFLARRQPLLWVITTAGDDPDRVTIGWEVHEKAQKILKARKKRDKTNNIPTWYPVIFSYEGDDIFNENNWFKANPSLGYHLRVEDLRELALEAKLSPADERTFRWLHLSQWVTTKLTTWLPIELFDQTNGHWSRADMQGRECYIGLDLSSTTDLSAICYLFPPQNNQEDWRVMWDFFIPEDNMKERIRVDRVPYNEWLANAWITATEGNVIDYTVIEDRILKAKEIYKVKELDADKTFATMLMQRLEQAGITCVDIPQRYSELTDPMNETQVLMENRQLTHEANPVARWNFGNTSISKNGNGQIKYVKEQKGKSVVRTKRIDGVAAWMCAMNRAMRSGEGASPYERHGLRTLSSKRG